MTQHLLGRRFFNLTRFAATLLFFAAVFALSHTAQAQQWNISFNAPNPVTAIRFLQEEGKRIYNIDNFHKGVCGGGRSGTNNTQFIWYCNSNGPTAGSPGNWVAATTPPGIWNDGYISDFAFKDTLTGWASIYGASPAFYNNPQVSGLMQTTDGGATWNFVTGPTVPVEIRGLYYSPASHMLMCSSGDVDHIGGTGQYSGAWVSTNDGVAWTRIKMAPNWNNIPNSNSVPDRCYFTGFASWDGTHITLATEGNPSPCTGVTPFDEAFWLYSADGGLTWKTSGLNQRSWQPVALKNTSNVYASSYDQTVSPPVSRMFMSPDNGVTWRPVGGFNQSQTAVTEVMGGDPCLVVAPDSNGVGNLVSIDDGRSWNPIGGAPEPIPELDLRTYVGNDSIWIFQVKNVMAIARPSSQPVHFSVDSIFFANSGCFMSDTAISIYGCNCTPTSTLSITGVNVTPVGGTPTNFAVTQVPNGPFCGPATFHVTYTPNLTTPDTVDLTVNYSNNGTPLTKTIRVRGNGAPTDFTTNWGSKAYPGQGSNSVVFRSVPCGQIDTFLTIYNSTCGDVQLIGFDTEGGVGNAIWYDKNDVPLPVTINQRGGSFTIPIHATATANGDYQLVILVTVKSGNTTVVKRYVIQFSVKGPALKPFVRGFDIHVAYPCMLQKALDSAVYYFDTTCLSSVISNIHLKNGTNPNFSIDLSKIHFPDTIISSKDAGGAGKSFFVRVPVHLPTLDPGTYSDSLVFEDALTDGTVLRTAAFIRYKIDKANDYTPMMRLGDSKNKSFGAVSACDSNRTLVFHFAAHDTCAYPDTLSSYSFDPGLGVPYFLANPTPTVGKGYVNWQPDSIVIGWPNDYKVGGPGQRGSIKLWFRNGKDSNSIQFTWDGYFVTGASFTTVESTSSTPVVRNCDSLVLIDSIHNNSCNIDVRVDAIQTISGPTPQVSIKPDDIITNNQSIPVRIVYTPTATDSGQICGTILVTVTDLNKGQPHADSLHWCVNVVAKAKSASISTLNTRTLACGESLDTTLCVTNSATCGEPVTFTSASTTAIGVTVGGSWPQTLAPGQSYCFPVNVAPPVNPPVGGTITGGIDVAGDLPQNVNVNFPYEGCAHPTVLKIDTTGKTIIVTPRCVTANDTIFIFDSLGKATITSITASPSTAGFTFTPPSASTPIAMQQGDRIYFIVKLDPDQGATGPGPTVSITYTDEEGNSHNVVVPMSALVTGSHYQTSLAVSSPTGPTMKPDMKMTKDFLVTLNGDQVPSTVGVQELEVTLKYNTNILIPKGLASGWTILTQPNVNETAGTMTFKLGVPAGQDLMPGTQIATVTMTAAVSDTKSTDVVVQSGLYNPSDANFTRCTLSASAEATTVPVTLDLTCTDSLAMMALQGKLTPADNIAINPNPAHKASGAGANLSFTAALDAAGAVDIVDMSGKTVAELAHGTLSHGEHIYAIPTPQLSEGTYFARIQIGGFTVVRKFILQKD